MDASEHIAQQSAEGRLESSGGFTLDLKRAAEKLGQFGLERPEEALLKLVQFGVRHRAAAVIVETNPQGLLVTLPAAQVGEAPSGLLVFRPDSPAHRELQMAFCYFLALGCALWVGQWAEGKLTARATTDETVRWNEKKPVFHGDDGLAVAVLYRSRQPLFNPSYLHQPLAFCKTVVGVNGCRVNGRTRGLSFSFARTLPLPDGSSFPALAFQHLNARLEQVDALVLPLQWGVVLDPSIVTGPLVGLTVVVGADDLAADLHGKHIIEGDAWEARLAAVETLLPELASDAARTHPSGVGLNPTRIILGALAVATVLLLVVF